MRAAPVLPFFVLALLVGGCNDDDQITVESFLQPQENRAPQIVLQGPDLTDVETENGWDLSPWVLVSDSDGMDDVTGVFLRIESAVVHRMIVRPADDPSSSCPGLVYAPNDTLTITSLVPDVFRDHELLRMENVEGGIYAPGGYSPFSVDGRFFPDVVSAVDEFERASCAQGSALRVFQALPPAMPFLQTVFLTHAHVEYTGISVTVYDAAGASATTMFPNLNVVYSTFDEKMMDP